MPATIYEFRVQYVDDVDPFNVLASIKHAEPTVAKRYKFASDLPLFDQVPAVKKTLRAPHKPMSNGGLGELNLTGLDFPSGPNASGITGNFFDNPSELITDPPSNSMAQ